MWLLFRDLNLIFEMHMCVHTLTQTHTFMGQSQAPYPLCVHTACAHTFFSKYLFCVHMCRGWNKALGPLQLELQVVLSHLIWVLETQLWSFTRTVSLASEASPSPTQRFSSTILFIYFFLQLGIKFVPLRFFVCCLNKFFSVPGKLVKSSAKCKGSSQGISCLANCGVGFQTTIFVCMQSVCMHGSIHVQRPHVCAEAGGQYWGFFLITLHFVLIFFTYLCVYTGVHRGVVVPTMARKECHNPWSWNYRRL